MSGDRGEGKGQRALGKRRLRNFRIYIILREAVWGKRGKYQESYQFSFLKRHSQKSLPASLFKGRRAFLNAFEKRFRFFPPVEWRQAYSTGGRKGDLTDFQRAKGLRYFQFAMMFGRFFKRPRGRFPGQGAVFRHDILLLLLTIISHPE
jgi:hypothetical protein